MTWPASSESCLQSSEHGPSPQLLPVWVRVGNLGARLWSLLILFAISEVLLLSRLLETAENRPGLAIKLDDASRYRSKVSTEKKDSDCGPKVWVLE